MAEEKHDPSSKIYDSLLGEAGTGELASKPDAQEGPALPRLRLATPSAKAPLTIKRKIAAASVLPSAAKLIPEILRQVDEARKAQALARASKPGAKVGPKPPALKVSDPSKPAPALRNSRVAWRYALVFGQKVERAWKGRIRDAGGEGAAKAIYKAGKALPALSRGLSPGAVAWAFLLPALLTFALFNWGPLLRGFLASFQEVGLSGPSRWVGLDHYLRAIEDPQVWATFGHAAFFCALALGLGFWLPVALALYANEARSMQPLLRFLFFLPFLTPVVPAVVVWRWILDQGYGLLNSLLSVIFMQPVHVPWLDQPILAMLSLVIVFLWKNAGWNALIYMTALKEVPEELYETAELDGASFWQRIRSISLPHLRNTMRFLLIMQVISTLQIFTEVFLLTGGGPMNSTEMIATYMYKRSFLYLDVGYAAALGVMLFVALLGFSSARLRALKEEA